MSTTLIPVKKTSVPGRVPNTFTLSSDGDIGINTHDGKMWISNGSIVFEIGTGGVGGPSDWSNITGKPTTFPPDVHSHAISDVAGLQANLNSKQALLVNQTNIKSINGTSLLGSGDLVISTGVSSHNALSGIQGGATSDYYHLTGSELSVLQSTGLTGSANITFDGGTFHVNVGSNTVIIGSTTTANLTVNGDITANNLTLTNALKLGANTVIDNTGKYVGPVNTVGSPAFITAVFDGGGNTIIVDSKCDLYVPFGFTINKISLLADVSGSIVIDIWKDSFGNFPPTVLDSICAAAPPTLSSNNRAIDTALTGWNTSVSSNTTLRFNVTSISSIKRCTLLIEGIKT